MGTRRPQRITNLNASIFELSESRGISVCAISRAQVHAAFSHLEVRTRHAIAGVPQAHFDAVRAHQAVNRNGEPEDQAAAISFIVSDDAAFMSGQTLLVDGGEGHV